MALLSRAQHKYEYAGQACLVPYVLCWYYRFSHCTNFLCEILAALALLFFLLRFLTPPTFTWRFKKILKANDLPTDLNVPVCATRRQACSSPAARTSARSQDCSVTVNRRPRWISTPTRLIRTRKRPARSCRAGWRSKLFPQKALSGCATQ